MLLAALLGFVAFMPATFLDYWVNDSSQGKFRVVDARGSIWSGSARLVSKSGQLDSGLAQWSVRPSISPLGLSLSLELPGLQWQDPNGRIMIEPGGMVIPAGRWGARETRFSELPGALGIARLAAAPSLRWPALNLASGGVVSPLLDQKSQQSLQIRLHDVSSGLAPIRPLGTIDVSIALTGNGLGGWQATTTPESVIDLRAQGDLSTPEKINGTMQCRRFCEYLTGFLNLLGKPDGDRYELRYGS